MCSIEQYRVGAPKPYNIATSVHWRCAHMTQSLLAVGNRIMRVAFYYNIDMICLRHKDGWWTRAKHIVNIFIRFSLTCFFIVVVRAFVPSFVHSFIHSFARPMWTIRVHPFVRLSCSLRLKLGSLNVDKSMAITFTTSQPIATVAYTHTITPLPAISLSRFCSFTRFSVSTELISNQQNNISYIG